MTTGMQLLDELCQTLFGTKPANRISYAEAFRRQLGINPHTCPSGELMNVAASRDIPIPAGMSDSDRDAWLHLLLATCVEPQLGDGAPEIIFDYPASQAALAKVVASENGTNVAQRFELYWKGVELANGYHELTDPEELRGRFREVNRAREAAGRPRLPMPEQLLAAMARGMPESTGVAMGFDRVVMLAAGLHSIKDVMAFATDPEQAPR
jgi:lysyl-tRNA synthetase class 2